MLWRTHICELATATWLDAVSLPEGHPTLSLTDSLPTVLQALATSASADHHGHHHYDGDHNDTTTIALPVLDASGAYAGTYRPKRLLTLSE